MIRDFIDGSLKGCSFCPTKTYKSNKQTTWNKSHLHGIAWSSGKLDYHKLLAVFCHIKVMNAEVFAKRLEKYRLLTRLLGQNVENLNDYSCPKVQDLVGEGKRTVRGSALITLSDRKQGFTVPIGKQRCMEKGLCNIYFCKYCMVSCIVIKYPKNFSKLLNLFQTFILRK